MEKGNVNMNIGNAALTLVALIGTSAAQAEDAAMIIGRSAFNAHCALCHGTGGKGDGEIAELFRVPPADLTKLSERAGGSFPFPDVYRNIVNGMEKRGHGDSEMPIWGDYFIADALQDRGVNLADAVHITQGRVLSLVYYLEAIQE